MSNELNKQNTSAIIDSNIISPQFIQQFQEILKQAMDMRFAEITVVVENGKPQWIRGPSPSVKIENK